MHSISSWDTFKHNKGYNEMMRAQIDYVDDSQVEF